MERINIKELTGDDAMTFMFRQPHLKYEFTYYNWTMIYPKHGGSVIELRYGKA